MKVAGIANAHASARGRMNGVSAWCVCVMSQYGRLEGRHACTCRVENESSSGCQGPQGAFNAAGGMVEGQLHVSHLKWSGPRVSLLVSLCWGTLCSFRYN